MAMRVCLVSTTGSVGKTTIAAHVLHPRMPEAVMLAVETVNETGGELGLEVERLKGQHFAEVYKQLLVQDFLLVDVGASNVESFLSGMVRFDGCHEHIERFVVPVTPGVKEVRECIKTVKILAGLGVPAERIRVVFNRVEESVADEFAPVLAFARKEGLCVANPDAAIFENEVYGMLAIKRIGMSAALADKTDYHAELRGIRRQDDPKRYNHISDMLVIQALARAASRNLDRVFSSIMG